MIPLLNETEGIRSLLILLTENFLCPSFLTWQYQEEARQKNYRPTLERTYNMAPRHP